MNILSKRTFPATALLAALLLGGCARHLPWRNQPADKEVNLSFTLERNLIELTTLQIDNRSGRFILGTAAPRTVVDPDFPLSRLRRHAMQISEKQSVRLSPVRMDLGGVADAIIGAEAWDRKSITIDYRTGLLSFQKQGMEPGLMQVSRFTAEPAVQVSVDGRVIAAIVDTSLPDTLILPAASRSRGTARVAVAGIDFGPTDVQFAPVPQVRIGNRLLSHFLVTIDYGKGMVGLWHDPRIPTRAP